MLIDWPFDWTIWLVQVAERKILQSDLPPGGSNRVCIHIGCVCIILRMNIDHYVVYSLSSHFDELCSCRCCCSNRAY